MWECGNEPRDSLKGNGKGWLVRVLPSFSVFCSWHLLHVGFKEAKNAFWQPPIWTTLSTSVGLPLFFVGRC